MQPGYFVICRAGRVEQSHPMVLWRSSMQFPTFSTKKIISKQRLEQRWRQIRPKKRWRSVLRHFLRSNRSKTRETDHPRKENRSKNPPAKKKKLDQKTVLCQQFCLGDRSEENRSELSATIPNKKRKQIRRQRNKRTSLPRYEFCQQLKWSLTETEKKNLSAIEGWVTRSRQKTDKKNFLCLGTYSANRNKIDQRIEVSNEGRVKMIASFWELSNWRKQKDKNRQIRTIISLKNWCRN